MDETFAFIYVLIWVALALTTVFSVIINRRFFSLKTTILILCDIPVLLWPYLYIFITDTLPRDLSENTITTISLTGLAIHRSIAIIYFVFMIRSVIKDFKDFQLKAN